MVDMLCGGDYKMAAWSKEKRLVALGVDHRLTTLEEGIWVVVAQEYVELERSLRNQ